MDAAKGLGIDISSLCLSEGTCGKCKVQVQKGAEGISHVTQNELRCLSEEELNNSFRLACQAHLTFPSVIFVPETGRVGKQRLQIDGLDIPAKPNPLVRKYFLTLPKPALTDFRSDVDRLLDSLRKEHGLTQLTVDYESTKTLPIVLRNANWNVTTVVSNDKIIVVEPGNTTDECFGFAVDIGTTKLAGFLVDLNTGKVLSVAAQMNPQIPFGEDVLSRITYATKHGSTGLKELHKAVASGINRMINECCENTGVKTDNIYELNFVGNTVMQMLFLELWPQYTALSPYPPVIRQGVDVEASKLGLKAHLRANAHFVPVIGGFVGADSVADLMAVNMLESEEIIMDIDIGTNTEVALGNKDLTMIVSCASGPAFEGMEIKHGMRASTGAIERISIDPCSLETDYITVEDAPAIGICGSGLIDALAELLKVGLIDMGGRFNIERIEDTDRLRKTPEGWYEYVIAWKNKTVMDTDIVVTQADIRELQKAKAAIRTGAEILLTKMCLTKDKIAVLYIAGAFGNYVDPESARTIGMYPELPIERIKFVGNTAGSGSRMCLVSKDMREYAERISTMVRYYELAADPNFPSEFVQATLLPHGDPSRQPVVMDMLRKLGRTR